jgi:hypothetical protein
MDFFNSYVFKDQTRKMFVKALYKINRYMVKPSILNRLFYLFQGPNQGQKGIPKMLKGISKNCSFSEILRPSKKKNPKYAGYFFQ